MRVKILFAIIICFSINRIGYSQWVQTNGPYGLINISTIVQYDSLLLSLTDCGLFSKNTLSASWSLNSTSTFISHTQKNDSLYVGTLYDGIKLIDLNNPNNSASNINTLKANTLSHSDSCLYAGNETQGFFKSNDNGISFNNYNSGLPIDTLWNPWIGTYYQTNVSCIEVTNNYIYCGTNKGMYRSNLNPILWEEKNIGLPLSIVKLIKEIDDTLYSVIDSNLYHSVNNGNSWNLLYSAPSNITSFLKDSSNLYVSTSIDGIQHSNNNGLNWYLFNTGLTDLSTNIITKYDTTMICGTSEKGFFLLQGNQWGNNNSGMICSSIRSMTSSNDSIIANSEEKVYVSNTGNLWTDISPNVTYDMFGSVNSMNDTIFLSVEYNTPSWPYDMPFIVFSPDNGVTWNNLINPVPFARDDPYRIYCNNGKLYAYEDEIMYYTDNLGISWTNLSLPSQYCNYFYGFSVYNSSPFAAACGNGELVKLDNTNNWISSNNGLPTDREPLDIASCDSALFTYVSVHGMYVSFDNGINWTSANNGLITDRGSISDFASYGSHLFISTENGVFFTSNYGQNWNEWNTGLKNINTSSLKILNDTLYVGTYGNGIWKQAIVDIPLSTTSLYENSIQLKIYPNPTHNQLFVDTDVQIINKIIIIDITGKTIKSIIQNTNTINVADLPSGIYFIKFFTKEKTITKKFVKQ